MTSVGLTCRLLAWVTHNMLTIKTAAGKLVRVEKWGVAAG